MSGVRFDYLSHLSSSEKHSYMFLVKCKLATDGRGRILLQKCGCFSHLLGPHDLSILYYMFMCGFTPHYGVHLYMFGGLEEEVPVALLLPQV